MASWTYPRVAKGEKFLDRTSRMSKAQRERFFFEEYIRKGHATRVREWITGRHSRKWGGQAGPIARAIGELLKPLPSRFRDYLGNVCESHHEDDLENRTKYPLYAVVGNTQKETVNVQYAAILLRTADLLHITKDRTPSVAYPNDRLFRPDGGLEWDEQRGVFSVRHKKKPVDPHDPESSVIVISADFHDDRPFFALSEYRVYADEQLQQSRGRWVGKA